MKKDYSEYKPSEYEKYRIKRSNNKYARYDHFNNKVRFDPEDKNIFIQVDPSNEYAIRMNDIDEYENLLTDGHPRPLYKDDDEKKELEEHRLEGLSVNEKDFSELSSRYKIDRSYFDDNIASIYKDYPDKGKEPLNNVLSGAHISLRYGEGLLDFIYADFVSPFKKELKFLAFLKRLGEIQKEDAKDEHQKISSSEKIYNRTQDIVEEYFRYASTVMYTKSISYSSLYTAICPPVFSSDHEALRALELYYNYLIELQKEYLELLEFCFDEEFCSEVLGHLHPAERYCLYRRIHKQPITLWREETFRFEMDVMSGNKMPYGLPIEEFAKRLSTKMEFTDKHKQFAEKYGMEAEELENCLRFPRFLNTGYEFHSVADILELEFSKILEQNIRFRKCKRCGKYVSPK